MESQACCLLLLQGGCLELLQGGNFELLSCGTPPAGCCLELMSTGCLELVSGGDLELMSCTPPPQTCPALPQSGIIATAVTWDPALFFNAQQVGTTIEQDVTLMFPINPNGFAGTLDAITANGQGFRFKLPALPGTSTYGTAGGLGSTTPTIPIDCGNNAIIVGNCCRWCDEVPLFDIGAINATTVKFNCGSGFTTRPFSPTDTFTILRCHDRVCMYQNDVFIIQSVTSEPPPASARFNTQNLKNGALGPMVSDVEFLTGIVCP